MAATVHETENLLFLTLLQLIVMIGSARLMNRGLRSLGQPGVVGEIIAGLLLGPSLFGHFFPHAAHALFGERASTPITIISQIGLILLMFQIGMDFEFAHLRNVRNTRAVMVVTLCSVIAPFAVGLWIGQASAPLLAPQIDSRVYSLFIAVGMAITAVPILGRILREYGLTRTEIGVIAICAAAVNDVIGWVLLAGVSAFAGARFSGTAVLLQVSGLLAFAACAWFGLRPLVNWLLHHDPPRGGELSANLMAIVLTLMFAMAICTYQLGIFAIFGGFAAGLLFHRHAEFVAAWHRQVGRLVLVFFLPVFFTYTGLRTNILGLSGGTELQWLAIVLAGAIGAKILPVYVAGRLCGFDHDRAAVLGTLMNTRALMELIVLNIGFDLGFIPQTVFTMLVIMAVVTTVMAGPLLKVWLPRTGHVVPVGVEA